MRKRIFLMGISSLLLFSCSPMVQVKTSPEIKLDKSVPEVPDVDVVKVKVPKGSFHLEDPLKGLPQKRVRVSLREVDLDSALVRIAEVANINAISLKKEKGDIINIQFEGELRDLVDVIARQTGTIAYYEGGVIYFAKEKSFSFVVPAYKDLIKEVEGSLKSLGATNVSYDTITSRVNFVANRDVLNKVQDYLYALKENLAMITFHVRVLELRYNKDAGYGIDWTRFVVGTKMFRDSVIGQQQGQGQGGQGEQQGQEGQQGQGGQQPILDFGTLLETTGNSLRVLYANSYYYFSINTFIRLLESYGKVENVQNFFVSTLTAKKGKIDVSVETPFVKKITQTTTANAGASTSVETDTAKTGVVLEIQPFYDRKQKVLSVDLKVDVLEVLSMVKLSAGNFGEISQPEISKKSIENTIRVRAGQVFVIGGLVFDRSLRSIAGLPLETPLTKKYEAAQSKGELILVVKPIVYEFEEEELPASQQRVEERRIEEKRREEKPGRTSIREE